MAQLWYDEVSDPKEIKGNERGKGNEGKTKIQRKPKNQRQLKGTMRAAVQNMRECLRAQYGAALVW